MNQSIVPIKNIVRLSATAEALLARPAGLPGMGLVFGETGRGKTVAARWIAERHGGILIRAMALDAPSSLLRRIHQALGLTPQGPCAAQVVAIVEHLGRMRASLWVDEADYLVDHRRVLETLRDIHDLSDTAVVLIGEERMEARLRSFERLSRRITHVVRCEPCDIADARLLADHLCDGVTVHDDLLDVLLDASRGSTAHVVTGLRNIETQAHLDQRDAMTLADWGRDRPFFHGRPPRGR